MEANYLSEEFLARWISGALGVEEQRAFEAWLKSNPSHAKDFEVYQKIWSQSGSLRVAARRSSSERWKSIQDQMQSKKQPLWFSAKVWRVAAAILIGVGVYKLTSISKEYHVSVPRGEFLRVVLPDSSEAAVYAESQLSYSENYWTGGRSVAMQGEVFFEVKKNGSPFTVNSGGAIVRVIGTSFNVRTRENTSEITCLTGKVQVMSEKNQGFKVELSSGLGTLIKNGENPMAPVPVSIGDGTGWWDGSLRFSHRPMREVFEELARQYNVTIQAPANLGNMTYTGSFKRSSAFENLDIVCLASGLIGRRLNDSLFRIERKE